MIRPLPGSKLPGMVVLGRTSAKVAEAAVRTLQRNELVRLELTLGSSRKMLSLGTTRLPSMSSTKVDQETIDMMMVTRL